MNAKIYASQDWVKKNISAYISMPYEWIETTGGIRIAEGKVMMSKFITDLESAKELTALHNLFNLINNMFYPTGYNTSVIYKNVVANIINQLNELNSNNLITTDTTITTYHVCPKGKELNDTREWKSFQITYAASSNTMNIVDGADMWRYITFNTATGEITTNYMLFADTTLTQAKKPADAAAVGTAVTEAKTYAEEKATEAARIMKDDILNNIGIDLTGYATKEFVISQLENFSSLSCKIVEILPDISEADPNTIYLVSKSTSLVSDIYDEYMAIEGVWERIGNTQVDLDGYVTEEWVQEGFQPKGEYLTEVPVGYAKIDDIPTKMSQLDNDAGYLKKWVESDPTVPAWAKESSKPSYSKSEVGLGNVDNVQQYSASNPPPYPVTSVNGKTGAVTVDVPTKVSQLTNDSGYLTQHQDISGKLDASALPVAINTALNRTTSVNVANTNYTTLMARGTSLNSSETNPAVNGAIAWTYE